MSKHLNHSIISLALLGLSACSLIPEYMRPTPPLPEQYVHTAEGEDLSSLSDWREYFTDPDLQSLIDLALRNNRDLRVAILRIEEARSVYGIQKADRLPTINGTLGFEKGQSVFAKGQKFETEFYRAGLGISDFELDFFGRVKSLSSAALEEFLSTEEAQNNVKISLISELANAYVNVLALNERKQLTLETLTSRRESFNRTKRRFEAGLDSALEFKTAEMQVDASLVNLSALVREYEQALNGLKLLTGDQSKEISIVKNISSIKINSAHVGMPSDLLQMRPDIKASEHRLKAANANIGAARAAFFPRIQLTTSVGLVNKDLLNLFAGGSDKAWNFNPQLILPIFNHGRNQANLDLTKVRKEVAVAEYEKTIQIAFREVTDVLVVKGRIENEVALQTKLVDSEHERLRLVTRRYNLGVANYLELLDAQRNVYAVDQQLIQLKQLNIVSNINLYKSLGGT
ncbi:MULTISPECIES: efflux transporter outer membrane subunit [Methylotenera]|uniref:efflux transporter outer membrane subunit n=1 Tax=Methylotenera TaxID=359407 RepID=UPI00038203AF|nr:MULTISPECIES: efflux transporter outer membrane subunit [Methylotenera]